MLPHPARSAYARFLTFSARTGLIGKGSKGSRAVSGDASTPRAARLTSAKRGWRRDYHSPFVGPGNKWSIRPLAQ